MTKTRRRLLQYSVLLVISLLYLSTLHARARPIIIGVHPYLQPSVLIQRFDPLKNYLQDSLKTPVRIRIGTSYEDHIQAFARGEIDLGFFGPASFVKLTSGNQRYRPLGRLSFGDRNTFRGAIVVHQNSPFNTLSDLVGRRFAFGDPNSTLSYLVPRTMLHDAGIGLDDLGGYSNLENHHNVALAVLFGKFDAGSVKAEVFREFQSQGLRALKWSPEIPTHLFVAGPGLSDKQSHWLARLLLNLNGTEQATSLLSPIKKGTTGIVPAKPEEYDQLRRFIVRGRD